MSRAPGRATARAPDPGARVSCVVATHDSRRWVREAIDSVVGQTRPPFEVLVVCSGSDGTAAEAATYGDPVRVLEVPDRSPAYSRNRGIAAARGELLAFIDGDDVWYPQKLERQLARFRERPELGACVTHVRNFWSDELQAEAERFEGHRRAGPIPGYATISLLARRQAFELAGLLREDLRFADSVEWFMRARAAGVVIDLLPEVLVGHRIRPGSLSHGERGEGRSEFLAFLRGSLAERRAAGEK